MKHFRNIVLYFLSLLFIMAILAHYVPLRGNLPVGWSEMFSWKFICPYGFFSLIGAIGFELEYGNFKNNRNKSKEEEK